MMNGVLYIHEAFHHVADSLSRASCTIWIFLLIAAIAALTVPFFVQSRSRIDLPCINEPTRDRSHKQVKSEFLQNAAEVIARGLAEFPHQPFKLIAGEKEKVILPHSYLGWLRGQRDLRMGDSLLQDFFGDYPGFEGLGAFQNDPSHFLINTVKRRLTKVSQSFLDVFEMEGREVMSRCLGEELEYHLVNVNELCHNIIPPVMATIFSGHTLAKDPEWIELIASYATNMVAASRALQVWPIYLRPLVHWFIPECRLIRGQIRRAQVMLSKVDLQDESLVNTAFAWSVNSPKYDVASLQLGLAFASIHTMTQLTGQCILDLALNARTGSQQRHKTLIQDLRREIEHVLLAETKDNRFEPGSISKLKLLDAVIKETQRFKSFNLLSVMRACNKKSIVLPNGTVLPKGTQVAIPTQFQWSPELWGSDAHIWNPYRFLNAESAHMQAVTTTEEHFAFGWGRFVCPGRFFAVAQIKVLLALLLLHWDFELDIDNDNAAVAKDPDLKLKNKTMTDKQGSDDDDNGWKNGRVPYVTIGTEPLVDWTLNIRVRRRPVSSTIT